MDKYINAVLTKLAKVSEIPLIRVNAGNIYTYIKPDDILYAEKSKRSILVYLSESAYKYYNIPIGSEIRIYDKLENLYANLKKYGFGYPHSSYIINFKYLFNEFIADGLDKKGGRSLNRLPFLLRKCFMMTQDVRFSGICRMQNSVCKTFIQVDAIYIG